MARSYSSPACATARRIGVDDGIRTHDSRDHNPGLYQLSYVHHPAPYSRLEPVPASRCGFPGYGAPGRTRTCDPRLRRPMLYPPELRAHSQVLEHVPRPDLVGAEGFEPPTLCSQSRCATRLRHAPTGRSPTDAPGARRTRPCLTSRTGAAPRHRGRASYGTPATTVNLRPADDQRHAGGGVSWRFGIAGAPR